MDLDLLRIAPVIVYPSLVLESTVAVKGEAVGGAYCTVLPGNILSLISEIGKVETTLLRSVHHVGKTVLGITRLVVAVNRDQSRTLGEIVTLQLDHPVLVSLNVRTMVTTEDDHDSLLVGETLESVGLPIHSFERKVDH